ncbi:MAG: efflux RND transporter periplasmic adaptor subunit [Castellaniella sp.]|uniref:efflux RND transporter periplasmic adaptor subunit n=1 Tax=Castellaniella sp. TaxID=1955812 RepID=UPI0012219B37|nr:efflux RND transporter periplasmic adaptor subunit [Castellaniella sp.]TAN26031.1 MAG: efflux RND transporter periplasmic adaptor subunit [Castellaniella sp.]
MLATSRSLMLLALVPVAAQCVAQSAPIPLPTQTVESTSPVQYEVWDGVVEATRDTTIAAQTNAKVLELPFDVGDSFTKGAVLARLSDVEQQAGLRSAQARLTAARAESREAGIHWKRTAELSQQHANSQAQLDAATARRDTSRANLDAAQAAVHSAEQQVSYTVIRAPFDGVILRRFVQAGQAVQSGPPEPQPILSIAALDSLRVDTVVPQTRAAAIRTANEATIRLDGNRDITGIRITVFPYADPASHTIHVRVDLPGKIENLYPGMTVPVAFPVPGLPRLLIPSSDIISRGELAAVYVLGPNDDLSLRQVRLGRESGGLIEVLAGLRAGERIVTDTTAAAQYLARQHAAGGPHP